MQRIEVYGVDNGPAANAPTMLGSFEGLSGMPSKFAREPGGFYAVGEQAAAMFAKLIAMAEWQAESEQGR